MALFICIILIFQTTVGFLSDALWTKERGTIPWWDKMHWWAGRLVFILGLVNCHLGIKLLNPVNIITWYAGFWSTVSIGFVVLIFGQIKIGQEHHVNGEISKKSKKSKKLESVYNPYKMDV